MRPSLRVGLAMALGCAFLFVGVAPTFAQGPDDPASIYYRPSIMQQINEAQSETQKIRFETFFCLIGREVGSDFYIERIHIPEQDKYVGFALVPELGRFMFVSRTTPKEECPEGTIGDLHTHPWQFEASRHDKMIWLYGDHPYKLHVVTYTFKKINYAKTYLKLGKKLYILRTEKPAIIGNYVDTSGD